MIEGLAIAAFAYLGLRILIALVNAVGPARLRGSDLSHEALVSVLIPARNEAGQLPDLLKGLALQHHNNLEIIVYDDNSEDETWDVIQRFVTEDSRVRSVKGLSLPAGWLGKNHACHQLAVNAKGDYLLYLDADVRTGPSLITDLLTHSKRHNLDLLSVFPVQQMLTMGELISVPLMNRILISLLPLPLSRLSKMSSLSAANGQCMFFKAGSYHSHQFHQLMKEETVEDIRISREMKRLGMRTEVLLSDGQIQCRMYTGYLEAVKGFARNFHHFFGKSEVAMCVFGVWTSLAPVITGIVFGLSGLLAYLAGTLGLQALVSRASQFPLLQQLWLMPLQHMAMLHIMAAGIYYRKRGKLEWKGRKIS